MESYQSVLQSSLVAHQTAVDAVESSFEADSAIRERVTMGIVPVAHVMLQTGIDRGINYFSKAVAQKTGQVASQVSEDFNNGGLGQVGRGILRRGGTRIVNAFTQESNVDDPVVDETNIDDIGEGFEDDFNEENFIPSAQAAEDDVGDIEELFRGTRNADTQEMSNLNEEEEDEIQPAEDEEDDEFFDADERSPLLDDEADIGEETQVPEELGGGLDEAGDAAAAAAAAQGTADTALIADAPLLLDPVTAVIGVAVAVGSVLAMVFSSPDHPSQPAPINPSFQMGS